MKASHFRLALALLLDFKLQLVGQDILFHDRLLEDVLRGKLHFAG